MHRVPRARLPLSRPETSAARRGVQDRLGLHEETSKNVNCQPAWTCVQTPKSLPEVAGILDFGNFSIVVQLIYTLTTTQHHNKQFVKQGFHLAQVTTVWGGKLRKRFCNMFSESSTGSWAELQLPCCPRKHVTKPLTQPAAPGCTYIRENITASLKKLHVGVLDIYIFDSQSSRKTATCSNQQMNLSFPLKIREVLARTFLPRERGPGRRRRGRHCASGRPRRPPPPLPLSGTSERTPLGRRPEGRHTNYTYRVVHQAMHRLLLTHTCS